MNGHTDSAGGDSTASVEKPKAIMKDINILGGTGALKPPAKLPKIPKKTDATKIKEEPTSPVKSPLKSPLKSPVSNGTTNGISPKKEVKKEDMSDEDMPLQASAAKESRKRKFKKEDDDDGDEDFKDVKKKKKKSKDKKKDKTSVKQESPRKKVKKEEEKEEVWKWWEEEPLPDGQKWRTLEHKGPYFPPAYERLPKNVKFYYDGQAMELSEGAEEVATFYAKMLEHDYTKKDIFNNNFFEDWRKEMTDNERKTIKKLEKCNFKEMCEYFKQQSEERKNKTKEEKKVLKEENAKIAEEYGVCTMDGHKQKVGNFRVEPPGLFRGRGDHPKQGKLKKRVHAKDVIINISKGVPVPEPPAGEKWKAITHDSTVSWLACWTENITGNNKYVMLNAATRMKGEKDWQKYETARKLKERVHEIREQYKADWKSKEMKIRQRGVAMYFIDKLALRAGHEKEEGESADTVGCCSLRVEHIKLHPEKDGNEYVVEFDFLGKDSIRYTNDVPVEKRVFKSLEKFKEHKGPGDDLFDRLNSSTLNKFLGEQMPGLTAKVFRTYNASNTLQQQLDALTEPDANATAKLLQYNRANRAVAILCNHQRAAPKTFDQQMTNLINKLKDKKKQIKKTKKEIKELKKEYHNAGKSVKVKGMIDRKKKQVERLEEQYFKLEVSMTDKEENKEIALGTSKLNYLDPRISIAWCKKNDFPIEKIYNKTQREKFQWAIDMTDETFVF